VVPCVCMSLSPKQKLWGKRLLLLMVASFLIMVFSRRMDISDPFGGCDGYYKACMVDMESIGQLYMFVLLTLGGGLIWHFADERKK
jgi:hypothetical protein